MVTLISDSFDHFVAIKGHRNPGFNLYLES